MRPATTAKRGSAKPASTGPKVPPRLPLLAVVRLGPRLVVAGTSSGVGKTTVATGLMAALRRPGPGGRARPRWAPTSSTPATTPWPPGARAATSTPGCAGPRPSPALAGRAGAGADVLVVEGVMGLFDGSRRPRRARRPAPPRSPACSRRRSCWWSTPSAVSASVAAMVHGFATFDPAVARGRRDPQPGGERQPRGAAARGAGAARRPGAGRPAPRRRLRLARPPPRAWCRWWSSPTQRPPVGRPPWPRPSRGTATSTPSWPWPARRRPPTVRRPAGRPAPGPGRRGRRRRAGVQLHLPRQPRGCWPRPAPSWSPFDPLTDAPPARRASTASTPAAASPRSSPPAWPPTGRCSTTCGRKVDGGLVTWAECGGLLWLARSLDGHALAGVLPADGRMTDRLTLGYRRARPRTASPARARPAPSCGATSSTTRPSTRRATPSTGRDARAAAAAGFATPTLLASYLHVHLAADPEPGRALRAPPRRGRADRGLCRCSVGRLSGRRAGVSPVRPAPL